MVIEDIHSTPPSNVVLIECLISTHRVSEIRSFDSLCVQLIWNVAESLLHLVSFSFECQMECSWHSDAQIFTFCKTTAVLLSGSCCCFLIHLILHWPNELNLQNLNGAQTLYATVFTQNQWNTHETHMLLVL